MDEGVNAPVIVIEPNVGVADPEMAVVPENVMVLEVRVEPALLTKLPFRSMALEPALKVPLESVKIPLMVIALLRVSVPDPVLDKLASAVVLSGSSGPDEIVPVV